MKNLIRNALRSFKTNKMSIIGLVFLLFFGLGAFVTMNNTTYNIKSEYTSISKQGNLHDLTAAELYEVGSPGYRSNTKGLSYEVKSEGSAPTNFSAISLNDFIKIEGLSTNSLYSGKEFPTKIGTYYVPIPEQTFTENNSNKTYQRTYHITLDSNLSTGLYSSFAKNQPGTIYTSFDYIVTNTYKETEEVPAAILNLQNLLNAWTETTSPSEELIKKAAESNIFSFDFNNFNRFIDSQTQKIYSKMTTSNTPLSMYIDDKYGEELDQRYFKSLNVTATSDNIFYKIINSNIEDTIDKIVLFKDSVNRYGNNLFSVNDWAPYGSDLGIYNLKGEVYKPGTSLEDFIIPYSFDDVATTKLYTYDEIDDKKWNDDKKFAYSQIIQIRFKRMLAGDITTTKLNDTIKALAATKLDKNAFYNAFYNDEDTKDIYLDYISSWVKSKTESVTISANGNVVFGWVDLGTPQTCTISNWTSRFAIINPQHLSANNKFVLDPSNLNNFTPYFYWYKQTHNNSEPSGEISQKDAKDWLNTLNYNQFAFWINPNTKTEWTEMVYELPDGSTVKVTRDTGENQWKGIDEKYISKCGGYNEIIWGCGITPDFMYPVVDLSRPTPNPKTESLVYCNDSGYNTIKLAFANSPVEEYLLGKFKSNVSSGRKQEIINDLNNWSKSNMIWPEGIKSTYFANDKSNVLNCSGFRVAYIPDLVSVIDLISIILTLFIGILAFIICFVIIKRFVERNRINIGIMRANGISKIKIALSLFPFALIPAVIGGLGAYFAGLLLQAPTLSLFKNYWTLPTPLIGFNWLTMVICILLPFILFSLICFIATLIVLRTKTVELMKAGSEFKANGFSRIAKKPFKYFGILTRFRVSLAFNSLSRLAMMAIMSCLTMTSLVFAFTTFDKLNQSKQINSSQFDYSFNVKLTTPTANGSTYDAYDYNLFGMIDLNQHTYNINWDTSKDPESANKVYSQFTRWYAQEYPGEDARKIIGVNGNLMMPSATDMNGQNEDLLYMADKVSSRLTLDYNLGASVIGISSNPWEIALALMPANSRNIAADCYSEIINIIGTNIAQATKTYEEAYPVGPGERRSDEDKAKAAAEKAGKWCYLQNDSRLLPNWYNGLSGFFELDEKSGKYLLTKHNWLLGFSDPFYYMICTAYKDPDIIKKEYPISYRQVAINWNADDPTSKKDELYTYIQAYVDSVSSKAKVDQSQLINIEGIKENSQYVKLTDKNGNEINSRLFDKNYLDSIGVSENDNPVIINAYAAHKYKLSEGSTITIKLDNMVDRFDRKLHPENFPKDYEKATLKVVGISAGTNGEAFYTSQNIANNLLGLPNGKSWNKTHRYMMWQTQEDYKDKKVPEVVDIAGLGSDGKHFTKYTFTSSGELKEPIIDTTSINIINDVVPVGFNGIYTSNKAGKPPTSSISLYSYTGMYPGTSVYRTKSSVNKFAEILTNRGNLAVANLMSGINKPKYYNACNEYSKLSDPSETQKAEYRVIVDEFINEMADTFGETTMVTALCGAMDVAASDLIYTNLISTVNLAQTSIMAIIIPITIIIVGIISNLIIVDSKKMAAMLKALGYSDAKNLMSILAMFVPTILIGLVLAIPLSFGVLYGYQALIFTGANILVDITQQWWYYVVAILGIGVILTGAYALGYASLKRDRLVDQIK